MIILIKRKGPTNQIKKEVEIIRIQRLFKLVRDVEDNEIDSEEELNEVKPKTKNKKKI